VGEEPGGHQQKRRVQQERRQPETEAGGEEIFAYIDRRLPRHPAVSPLMMLQCESCRVAMILESIEL